VHLLENVKLMNTIMLSGENDRLTRPMSPAPEEDYNLDVAVVYQDSSTRAWADDVVGLMAEQAGEGAVQSTAWLVNNLTKPGSFTQGIQVLAEADAIVMSLHKADQLPPEFYRWVNLWLEVRSGRPGALVGLVGPADEQDSECIETRRYLQAVAHQGGLELFLKECTAADPSTNFEPDDLRPLLKAA